MKIDFKTLTMMELRSGPGEILDRVAKDGEVFVVERNGQPKACLVPVSFLLPDVSPDRIAVELQKMAENKQDYRLTINEKKELEITFLESVSGEEMPVSVVLPHGYPESAPRIYVLRLPKDTPMLWPDGSLSIYGSTAVWSPKSHNALNALSLARIWLKQFTEWQKTGDWKQETLRD